ncbi:MAG: 50S ribosomal protein L11 methyltransferase [Crocinitomicaceae bacterium]
MNYYEVKIEFNQIDPWREIIISMLAEKGAESFTESKTGCQAYFPENTFTTIEALELDRYKESINSVSSELIKDQNWNAEWESNFEPVFVGDKLAILAPFHKSDTKHKIKVIIQPQMSFGTGHHQTTWLMSMCIMSLEITNKIVLDMGTGTGVLAILAEKLGAKEVFAPDIDKWAYQNSIDNCQLNDCKNIELALGGVELLGGRKFDVIIANINKNILTQQFESYKAVSNEGTILLISGFFATDIDELRNTAENSGFIFENSYSKDEWALIEFHKH